MQVASPKGAAALAGAHWQLLPQPALLAGAGKGARGGRVNSTTHPKSKLPMGLLLYFREASANSHYFQILSNE